MSISFHKEVTTPEALASSIDNDHHVLRWFTLLAAQPSIRTRENKKPNIRPLYTVLRKIIAGQFAVYIFLWGSILTLLYLRVYNALWLGLVFIFPLLYLHLELKKCVRDIGMDIVSKDFDPVSLRQKTLYQISEFYSRQYQIPSLVDNIFTWDNAARIAVIAMAILAGQMIPLIIKVYRVNFILTFLLLIGICYLIFATIHTFMIYKYLQSSPQKD